MDKSAGSGLGLWMLFKTALDVPAWEYALLAFALLALSLYYGLEFHLLEDLCSGFRGHPAQLLYNPASKVASRILPKCEVLKQRYWPTPWICSPHLQTAFLHFFGRPPQVEYYRQLCRTPDGGTIALDWLNPYECLRSGEIVSFQMVGASNEIPTVVVIPGLTSDSEDAYVKHIAHSLAKKGWRVVVANHRGLGGVSITSNQFYNAGWTEDLRLIINYLHEANPKAPLFAVGTSIGANLLVKYLGEEGENTPLGGATAICCPWDLVVCDRFICRGVIQKIYDKILAFGLRSYAQVHQIALSRIADWDLISKSRSIRDFDKYCTRLVGQFETVDTYYRKCSSAYYLDSVSIPLLCISALDDPVCTREAIPWDECRVNANIVLGVTNHGGHLAFFEGLTASSIWWVRATTEYLEILCASSLWHRQKQVPVARSGLNPILESAIDKSPYINISEDGVVGADEVSRKPSEKAGVLGGSRYEKERMPPSGDVQEKSQVDTKASVKSLAELEYSDDLPVSQKEENAVKMSTFRSVNMKADIDSQASSSESSGIVPCHQTLKLSIRDHSELLSLESTLSQLLQQVETLKVVLQKGNDMPVFGVNMLKDVHQNSSLPEWHSLPVGMLASSTVLSAAKEYDSGIIYQAEGGDTGSPVTDSKRENVVLKKTANDANTRNENIRLGFSVLKGMKGIAAQNRHTVWLLAYVAIVTTWPLVGSALSLYGRRWLKTLSAKYWPK